MQLYVTATPSISIIHELWSLVDADITAYPLNDAVRRINAAYEELIAMILNADGTWQYDDTNWTDSPVGTGTLVEGQESYSFASEYLEIEQIDIKDVNGVWRKIQPLDSSELGPESWEEYFGVDSSSNPLKGMPEYYDKLGDTIRLGPAPTSTSVTLSNGLKVHFKRTADLFTISDTTQSPGLPSTHHVLLAYMAAIPYAMAYKQDRVGWLEKKSDAMKKTLLQHFGNREKDRRKKFGTKFVSFR